MNSQEVIRYLERDGWQLVRSSGSHKHFRHETKPGTVTIPHPKRDIAIKTLLNIERQACFGLKPERVGAGNDVLHCRDS